MRKKQTFINTLLHHSTNSVPYARGDFEYYSRTIEGKQYKQYCRKKRNTSTEEILLDLNEIAESEKLDYLSLEIYQIRFVIEATGSKSSHLHHLFHPPALITRFLPTVLIKREMKLTPSILKTWKLANIFQIPFLELLILFNSEMTIQLSSTLPWIMRFAHSKCFVTRL